MILTTEQITQLMETSIARLDELNAELAGVDDKIREREALRAQLDWLEGSPALRDTKPQAGNGSTQTDLTKVKAAFNAVTEQVAQETAVPKMVADAPPAHSSSDWTDNEEASKEEAEIDYPADREALRKLHLPDLKKLAKAEDVDIPSGPKADIVAALAEHLFEDSPEDDPDPVTHVEAAPEPQQEEPAHTPPPAVQGATPTQAAPNPFNF